MPVFAYIARAADRQEKGTLVADSAREARDTLRDRGLDLQSLIPKQTTAAKPTHASDKAARPAFWSRPRLPARHHPYAVAFLRELATLTEVGVPVLEAIDILVDQQPTRAAGFKTVLQGVRDRVAAGASLSDALGEARSGGRAAVFDAATVAMIRVGQEVGQLGGVLAKVADYHERRSGMKNRLAAALTYPAVVGAFGLGVCVFLMTFVVPGILEALDDSGRPLPWPTRVVKGFSDLLVNQGLVLGMGLIVIAVFFTLWLRSPAGRARYDRLVLSLPIIGEVIRKQAVVRLSFMLSTLLEAGVSFERALGIARHAVRNTVLRDAIERCEQAVHEGRDLGPALSQTKAFPATVAKVFGLGQASGRLSELLSQLADSYDAQVASLTTRLTTLVEPVLIVLLALLVGLIAFATLLPILEIGHAL